MEDPLIAEANEVLRAKGYRRQFIVVPGLGPGRAMLKGSRIVSPLSDDAKEVLRIVRERVPTLDELGKRKLTPRELRERR